MLWRLRPPKKAQPFSFYDFVYKMLSGNEFQASHVRFKHIRHPNRTVG